MTLPGFHECPECEGDGEACSDYCNSNARNVDTHPYHVPCRECGGAGQVPDDDTVEMFAQAHHDLAGLPLDDALRSQVRAALLAYARHTQETKP